MHSGVGLPRQHASSTHSGHSGHSDAGDAMKRALHIMLDSLDQSMEKVNQETAAIALDWTDLEERRANLQDKLEEIGKLKAALETQIEENKPKGLFAACTSQGKRHKSSVEIKKALRMAAAKAAMAAYDNADIDGDDDLTLEELRKIEGANAEKVMAEADKDNSGGLSRAEYRLYKVRCALQDAKTARSAKRQALKTFDRADVNHDGDLTIVELREVEGDNAEKVMREADADGNGVLSKEEYRHYKARAALAEANAARHAK